MHTMQSVAPEPTTTCTACTRVVVAVAVVTVAMVTGKAMGMEMVEAMVGLRPLPAGFHACFLCHAFEWYFLFQSVHCQCQRHGWNGERVCCGDVHPGLTRSMQQACADASASHAVYLHLTRLPVNRLALVQHQHLPRHLHCRCCLQRSWSM